MNKLLKTWLEYKEAFAESDKLQAKARKLDAESDKLQAKASELSAESDKLSAESDKLDAESDMLQARAWRLQALACNLYADARLDFINEVIKVYGKKCPVEWNKDLSTCIVNEGRLQLRLK